MTTNLVIIGGPVGVGKTSLGEELSERLVAAGIAHTFVDLDALSKTYPRPEKDRFGTEMALKNLASVWSNAQETGVQNLLIARVVETAEDVQNIERNVGATDSVVVELIASDTSLLERVRKREIGAGRIWHEKRALELSEILSQSRIATFKINTDSRSIGDIAEDVKERIHWM